MGEGGRIDGEDLTYFAKAGRATNEELTEQVRRSLEDPCIKVVLEAVQGYLMILNSHRQVVAANQEFLDALGREDPAGVIGLRSGEALECAHFTEGPDGCGTGVQCRTCGATLAILASQERQVRITDECRLSSLRDGGLVARDFRVTCTPLTLGDARFTAFVLHDISSEKRREVLEQTFLRDYLASLSGLEAWSRMLGEREPSAAASEIVSLTQTLKEEVYSHRALLQAEQNELVPAKSACSAASVLARLRSMFESHPARRDRELQIDEAPSGSVLFTDSALLLRVLVNMVKNAFEATPLSGVVRVWFEARDGRSGFVVHNPGVIAAEVRPHLFERSYSTRPGKGRGIGTYCMKLFGERYLGGTVSYSSDSSSGTRFWIFLPPAGDAARDGARRSLTAAVPAVRSARRALLVEDDEPLARLAALFLKRLGFDATVCRDGVEAEAAFKVSPDVFDVVLTDVNMPRMGGLELGRRLLGMRAGLPVLLCTGASDPESERAVREEGFRGIITKPYTFPSLAAAIEKAVPRRDSAR